MEAALAKLLEFLAFVAPCYVANAAPVALKNVLPLKTPIDMGRSFIDGRRILGDGKTVEGFLSGVAAGLSIGAALSLLGAHTLWGSFVLSLGAMCGDALGSFVKRRLGVPRGRPLPVVDQLTFVLVALAAYELLVSSVPLEYYLLAVLLTGPLHLATNYVAYRLGLKEVPW